MKWKIVSAVFGVLLLMLISLMICGLIVDSTGTTTDIQTNKDPLLPNLTRQDRGWVDPTGRVKASTLDALRDQADVFETEGFQLAGVFFADVVSDPSKIAADFGNQNGIGSAKKDNGLVILVLLDRQGTDGNKPYIFVATGKGLEGVLNDAKVTRFREAYFNPLRSQGQWEQGLVQLCRKFAEYLKNPSAQAFSDASLEQQAGQSQPQSLTPLWITLGVLAVIFIIALLLGRRRKKRGGPGGGWGSSTPWSSGSSGGGSYGGGGSFGGGGSGG